MDKPKNRTIRKTIANTLWILLCIPYAIGMLFILPVLNGVPVWLIFLSAAAYTLFFIVTMTGIGYLLPDWITDCWANKDTGDIP